LRESVEAILRSVASGELSISSAMERLALLPFSLVLEGKAGIRLDLHRPLRTGIGEVIYCPGKGIDRLVPIARAFAERGLSVAFSRMTAEEAEALGSAIRPFAYDPSGRLGLHRPVPPRPRGRVAVISAGAADRPAADEAAGMAAFCGCPVDRYEDVGVAGLHRLLAVLPEIRLARAVVVAAGMEGALPGVVAGLFPGLTIGLPTSVGYGVAEGGRAALRTILASCVPGLVAVNIDDGVGAGIAAALASGEGGEPDEERDRAAGTEKA